MCREIAVLTMEVWWVEQQPLKDVYIFTLEACEYVTLYGKRTSYTCLRLRPLRQGNYLGFSRWDNSDHMGPYKGRTDRSWVREREKRKCEKDSAPHCWF